MSAGKTWWDVHFPRWIGTIAKKHVSGAKFQLIPAQSGAPPGLLTMTHAFLPPFQRVTMQSSTSNPR
jgi:hypothetical protein